MFTNVGALDRWLRAALGAALLCLVFYGPQTAWGWLGILPLLTGVLGFCPLYSRMGWNTEGGQTKRP